MQLLPFVGAALLGLALSSPALAQTTVPGAAMPGGVTPAQPGELPTAVPPGAVPATATMPTGTNSTAGTLYPNGVPVRNLDGGTQRADQPRSGNPATTGSQPTKRLNRGRTTTAPVQP